MFKKLFSLFAASLLSVSTFVSGVIDYEIQDIGTLQTHSSEAIAINNQGQILGWYNVDGSKEGKHFFIRDRDGVFHEIPDRENGVGREIEWKFLTNNGDAYGTFDGNANFSVIYIWDRTSGVYKLDDLPGKNIVKVNDAGQVLISCVQENEEGRTVKRPVIWQNGTITKLRGLEGNLGIESEESYGYDINNKGEVVGKSKISLIYKNNVYYQFHAVKWVNGKAVSLKKQLPNSQESSAIAINDVGDVIASIKPSKASSESRYLLRSNNVLVKLRSNGVDAITNKGTSYFHSVILDENGRYIFNKNSFNEELMYKQGSLWTRLLSIAKMNDSSEFAADVETTYGEKHAALITPVEQD